ncbi:hypothetical protein Bbelb_275530 [Branchiostoma belcheri]|nr:hypothetical protein Bbelb_275530 [Branchiostoma belcheri]
MAFEYRLEGSPGDIKVIRAEIAPCLTTLLFLIGHCAVICNRGIDAGDAGAVISLDRRGINPKSRLRARHIIVSSSKSARMKKRYDQETNGDGSRYRLPTTFDPVLTSHFREVMCTEQLDIPLLQRRQENWK